MAHERKCLLIVDDTEIDRIILKSILSNDFELLEAKNGNIAFEYITTRADQLDGILLDIAMPHIDGFDVLRFMQDKGVTNIPVFLVTAEPTIDNVKKAMQYNIVEFIGKPFDREDILRRLRSRLGLVPRYEASNEDLKKTRTYISELETLYKRYLSNFGKNDDHYKVMSDLMKILLKNYNKNLREDRLPAEAIDLISKAAYFCDIGEIFLPDKRYQIMMGETDRLEEGQQNHTVLGANLIRLNCAKSCEFFVEVCSNMCLHHHERYDGEGYPSRLVGENNSIYNQMCRLVDEFDQMHMKFYGDKVKPIKFIVKHLAEATGMVSPKLGSLLEDCEPQIADYFMKKGV